MGSVDQFYQFRFPSPFTAQNTIKRARLRRALLVSLRILILRALSFRSFAAFYAHFDGRLFFLFLRLFLFFVRLRLNAGRFILVNDMAFVWTLTLPERATKHLYLSCHARLPLPWRVVFIGDARAQRATPFPGSCVSTTFALCIIYVQQQAQLHTLTGLTYIPSATIPSL